MDNKTIKNIAIDSFNEAWTYLDKEVLTEEEKGTLLNLAHTSLELWKKVDGCTADNLSIGYWQVSRAYAHINDYDNALLFGKLCEGIKEASRFCIGYSYEAIARAYILAKNKADGQKYLDKISLLLPELKDNDEINYLTTDLNQLNNLIEKI